MKKAILVLSLFSIVFSQSLNSGKDLRPKTKVTFFGNFSLSRPGLSAFHPDGDRFVVYCFQEQTAQLFQAGPAGISMLQDDLGSPQQLISAYFRKNWFYCNGFSLVSHDPSMQSMLDGFVVNLPSPFIFSSPQHSRGQLGYRNGRHLAWEGKRLLFLHPTEKSFSLIHDFSSEIVHACFHTGKNRILVLLSDGTAALINNAFTKQELAILNPSVLSRLVGPFCEHAQATHPLLRTSRL